MGHGADIEVCELRTTATAGAVRVSATVNGEELFFESADLEPACSPELFATVLLPVAVQRGVRLRLDQAPDGLWRRGVAGTLRVWAAWWGTEPDLERVLDAPRRRRRRARRQADNVGLCFSLGVDSFHTLLRSGRSIDRLILAHGFDIPLDDEVRMAAAERSLRDVAESTGTVPTVIRTNVRRHPTLRPMAWPRTHGGSLAALGHAASNEIGELLISATKPYVADAPWGSHWDTDPGYSSSRVAVTHVGAEHRRNEKLAALVGEPLVRHNLRVCWENRAAAGNCGECEKCVRTMLLISVADGNGGVPAFPPGPPLAARVDSVPAIHADSLPVYEGILANGPEPATAAAIERLLERS